MLNLLKLLINITYKLRQLDNCEQEVLIAKMPIWYSRYQYGFISRCIRLIAILISCSTWYHSSILQLISSICKKYNIIIFDELNFDKYLSGYAFLVIFCITFLFVHCLFNALIRIVFFKNIVKNSPISITQCISTGFSICRYSAGFAGLLLGVPGIDYVFERNGQIPPLRGFYMQRQIEFFGANEINCAITEGSKLPKIGIIRRGLSMLQDYTQNKEIIANTAYINCQPNNNSTIIVVKALKK